ncbi:TPA: hypothetical protein ACJIXH_005913 [Escherichia coli]
MSNVAVHRMGALSDYALGVVPKLFNLGSYPSDRKNPSTSLNINAKTKSDCTHSQGSKSQAKPIWTAFFTVYLGLDVKPQSLGSTGFC